VKPFFDGLARRRAALVERSAAQRGELATAAADLQRATAAPVLIGAGLAASLLATSPRLRGWVVQAWAAYAFARQLFRR
jgi:hypothetical protein